MKARFFPMVCKNKDEGGGGQAAFIEDVLNVAPLVNEGDGFEDLDDPTKVNSNQDLDDPEKDNKPEALDAVDQTPEPEPTDENGIKGGSERTDADIIKGLQEEVMRLMELVKIDPLQQAVQENVAPQGSSAQTQEPAQQVVDNQTLQQYLTPEELDRVLDEPGLINTAISRALINLPQTMGAIIQNEVQKQLTITKAITDFYTVNDDLLPHSKYVQFIMAEQERLHKDVTYAEIFDLTAKECRKRLGLKSPNSMVDNKPNNGQQRPAFARGRQSGGKVTQEKYFDQNAADMFD